MSQELIYTSAPRGLKPGSQGFCTVVNTQGIAVSLVQRLEALSGYRHVFTPPDPNARLNPVLFSHLILSIAGRRCHVLSRVCDAGLDHTQRTNKFAHHVVLDPREVVPGGPAWLLAAPGFMQSAWDGVPRVLPAGRRPPATTSPAAICRAWQQVAGDAGWGGALAETALTGVNRPAVIVYRPGILVLPLLAESLALLPAEIRWNVSFCTFFSKLPPGIDCQWRCVLEGSPEAISAARTPGALVIDLCKPLGPAPNSELAQAARSGVAPLYSAPGAKQPAVAGAYRATDAELPRMLGASAAAPAASTAPLSAIASNWAPPSADATGADTYDLGPPPRALDSMGLSAPAMPRKARRKPKSKWPLVAGLTATIVILVLGIVGFMFARKGQPHEDIAKATSNDVAKATNEQKDSIPSKVSADSGSLRTDANKPQPKGSDAAERTAAEKKRSADEAAKVKLEKSVEEEVKKASAAADEAQTAASNAAKAVNLLKPSAGTLDMPEVDRYEKEAADAADLANSKATEAANAADAAATKVAKGTAHSDTALSNAEIAKNFANLAHLNAGDAVAYSHQAKKLADEARQTSEVYKKKQERAKAIADSLYQLNDKVVPFPNCNDSDALKEVAIGAISDLDAGNYKLSLIGSDSVFSNSVTIDVAPAMKPDRVPRWECNMSVRDNNGGSAGNPERVLTFFIKEQTLFAQWTDMARSNFRYSNQLRNCLWRVSVNGDDRAPGATIALGEPESAPRLIFKLPKLLDKGTVVDRPVDITTSLSVDRAIAIEPLERDISVGKSRWPVEVFPATGDPTLRGQNWNLSIGKKDKASIHFSLVGRKETADGKVKVHVALKFERGGQELIEEKHRDFDQKKKAIAKKYEEIENAKKDKKGELEVQKHRLEGERDALKNELDILTDDLNQLCAALDNQPLQYRIVLRFGDKSRVLYTYTTDMPSNASASKPGKQELPGSPHSALGEK
jgi:hypothetical protein